MFQKFTLMTQRMSQREDLLFLKGSGVRIRVRVRGQGKDEGQDQDECSLKSV